MTPGIAASEKANDGALGELLRGHPLFAGLPDEHLDQVLAAAAVVAVGLGRTLIVQGDAAMSAYLIIDGELEILQRTGDNDVLVAVRGPGEVVGEMGLFSDGRRNASVRARTDATVLEIQQEDIRAILEEHPSAAVTMLRTTMERFRGAQAQILQHQKMVALGTLAAGMAHELNNPAAAVARTTGQLREAVIEWERSATSAGVVAMTASNPEALDSLRRQMSEMASSPIMLDPITRGDREDQVVTWLDARGIVRSWVAASQLVDAGWDREQLQSVVDRIPERHLADVVQWLAAGQTVSLLLRELATGTKSISSIVSAVKAYTRLDQAPVQDVDIHQGLDETLTILKSKLRGIHVQRDYAPDLPHITSYASELNQVWTNIIDNAIDALDGSGEIAIRSSREGSWVVVEIADDGPGIAPEIQARLFEPFFTTKPPGKGTGLGLSIAYTIVRKHRGEIGVESQPSCTRFIVRLPIDVEPEGEP